MSELKIRINEALASMPENYLFYEIEERIRKRGGKWQSGRLISLGIGDLTLPLPRAVAAAMSDAALKMAEADGFVGYQPTRGLLSLRSAISRGYRSRGVELSEDEIFINNGAKGALSTFCDILGNDMILVTDPTYPVYLDSSRMSGRRVTAVSDIEGARGMREPFVAFLCSPNNPTGEAMDRCEAAAWVELARATGSLIIFDAAYEAYISERGAVHSIYEIEGARECAVEIGSFSKSAGFTGIRCGWCVVPAQLHAHGEELRRLYLRERSTRENGVSYISQTGALAALTPQGEAECAERIATYMRNASLLAEALGRAGYSFGGGVSAPYLWVRCKKGLSSWETFDDLLDRAGIICTPGSGFGRRGEGYIRLSAFAKPHDVAEAAERLSAIG